MKLNLINLQPGDVLVCRDGTRRTFRDYVGSQINSLEFCAPSAWRRDGSHHSSERAWDIVRVIRNRPAKTMAAKDDADARWLSGLLVGRRVHRGFEGRTIGVELSHHDRTRLRRIATRLNGGRKVKP